jgi:transposase
VAPYLALCREDAAQRNYPLRDVFNGLRYLAKTGNQWRFMPNDLPPWTVVYQQMRRWIDARCFEIMVEDLRILLREFAGRKGQPTAMILDSRTLQSTPESGGLQFPVLLHQRTDNHFGAALLGRERIDRSLLPLPLPGGQVRGVESLAPQQDTHGTGIPGGIGLVEDRALILAGEVTPARPGYHLRIGNCRVGAGRRGARCVGSFSATLRSCQRSGRSACLACAYQSEISFPALQ